MRRVVALALLAALLVGCAGSADLPQVSPEEAGLAWHECEVSGYELPQAKACLGTPLHG